MDYSMFIVSHQKEESISIQGVNWNVLWVHKRNVSMRHPKHANPLSAKKKMHLKMSSAEVVCCKWLPNITDEWSIEANSMDPEQTAPIGAVWSWSTLFAIEAS